jgi:hypothetical protein
MGKSDNFSYEEWVVMAAALKGMKLCQLGQVSS